MRPDEMIRDGQALRAMREAAGYTQSALARLINRDETVVSLSELGRSKPTLATIHNMIEVLGPSVGELWGYNKRVSTPGGQLLLRMELANLSAEYLGAYIGRSESAIRAYQRNRRLPTKTAAILIDSLLSRGKKPIWEGIALSDTRGPRQASVLPSSPGEIMRAYRRRLGVTQAVAAQRSGIKQSVWSAYERDRLIPPTAVQKRIASVLGTRPQEIWGGLGGDPQWILPEDTSTPERKLKSARILRDLSREDLAANAGCLVETVTRYEEDGLPRKAIPVLSKLAQAVGVPIEELVPIPNADSQIGPHLKLLRLRAGLSLEEVADRLGVSHQRAAQMEKLRGKKLRKHTKELAQVLGVAEEELSID